MPSEPSAKQAVAFFDGQNLFHAVKAAFGYRHPNYEPRKLANAICCAHGWHLVEVRFYTGVPDVRLRPNAIQTRHSGATHPRST